MAEFTVRPMPGQGEATVIRHHWSDEKRCRSLSLTQDAWKILGALANDCGNRSEVVEIITRYAYNANLDLNSIRKELLQAAEPEPKTDACGITPPATANSLNTSGVDACGLKPPVTAEQPDTCGVDIDFDAPVQCSI